MKSVYILGGAGTGKSTFTAELLSGYIFGPHVDVWSVKGSTGRTETLRGHYMHLLDTSQPVEGFYLGRDREQFPGTDGLSRSTVIAGQAWLRDSTELPAWMVGEGATFATVGFLNALREESDLLAIHLAAPPEEVARRCAQRGSNQDPAFMKATVTRSFTRADELRHDGARVLWVDTTDTDAREMALDITKAHLGIVT